MWGTGARVEGSWGQKSWQVAEFWGQSTRKVCYDKTGRMRWKEDERKLSLVVGQER